MHKASESEIFRLRAASMISAQIINGILLTTGMINLKTETETDLCTVVVDQVTAVCRNLQSPVS